MYTEITVIVEGAEDDSIIFDIDEYNEIDAFIDAKEAEAKENGLHYEIYVDNHEHDQGQGECFCNQMQNDMFPEYEFNKSE